MWLRPLALRLSKLTFRSRLLELFNSIPDGVWGWMTAIICFTLIPSIGFVVVELFRSIKPDGSNEEKSKRENFIEGCFFLFLVLAWIPSVGLATTPGGPASLIGNAYFFTWILVVFVFEGLIWWIHDYRLEIHQQLRKKAKLYKRHQAKVLNKTEEIRRAERESELRRNRGESDSFDDDDEEEEIGLAEPEGSQKDVVEEE